MRVLTVLVLTSLAFSGCASVAPTESEVPEEVAYILGDPTEGGPLAHVLEAFDLGNMVIQGGGEARYLVHVHGEATVPEGDGPFPMVILMHGRHGTCAISGSEMLLQPCPSAGPVQPVPSYAGYRYLAENLASHGMLTISVDANNVNDHDNTWGGFLSRSGGDYGATARANIIFALIAAVEDGSIGDFASKADTDNVGLMGHSRGGEGVIRATHMHLQDPDFADVGIQATMALAPTDFARWELTKRYGHNEPDGPEVPPFATILPYCDGDVSNLQGVWAYDDSRGGARHLFLHMGANHNYYNTVWTRTDFGTRGDPYCDENVETSGRSSADDQRTEGLAMMAAFFRVYLQDDLSVLPHLTGEAPLPRDVGVRYIPDEGAYWVVSATATEPLIREGNISIAACAGSSCPGKNNYATKQQLAVSWDGPGAFFAGGLRGEGLLRAGMAIPPGSDDSVLDARLAFYDETRPIVSYSLRELGARILPGDSHGKTMLTDVLVPIPEGAGNVGFLVDSEGVIQIGDWIVTPFHRGIPAQPAAQ